MDRNDGKGVRDGWKDRKVSAVVGVKSMDTQKLNECKEYGSVGSVCRV